MTLAPDLGIFTLDPLDSVGYKLIINNSEVIDFNGYTLSMTNSKWKKFYD